MLAGALHAIKAARFEQENVNALYREVDTLYELVASLKRQLAYATHPSRVKKPTRGGGGVARKAWPPPICRSGPGAMVEGDEPVQPSLMCELDAHYD